MWCDYVKPVQILKGCANNFFCWNRCNVVATWPRHVISLIIISNNIPLSPLIAFTYRLVPDGSLFWYTKPYSSIVGNRLSYIALLRSPPAAIPFVEKRSLRYPTAVLIPIHQHPICWDATLFDRIPLGSRSSLKALRFASRWLDHPITNLSLGQ